MLASKPENKKHSVISFFSGCGGLDLGFIGGFKYAGKSTRRLRFDIKAAYDNEKKCVETYALNIATHAETKDLAKLNAKEIPKADVLIGGFPCQDFATCGPRRGLSSNRGRLYRTLVDYAVTHKPKVIVGENVPGLANMHNGEVLKTIADDIRSAGYKVEIWTLYAPDYGIPQRRTRLFIIGVRENIKGFPIEPKPTHKPETYKTTRWAIEDLEKIVDESVPNQSQYFKASKAKKGNGQGDERNPADSPSYTIRANAKSRVQFHYSLDRRLTVRECARLQTFPDDFVFPHAPTTSVMQIGNAVPPLLAHIVARSIEEFLTK